MSTGLDEKFGTFLGKERTTTKNAVRSGKARESAIEAQKKKEELRLAEASSAVAKRKLSGMAGGKGRGSLISTSPTGLATNLGGTQNG